MESTIVKNILLLLFHTHFLSVFGHLDSSVHPINIMEQPSTPSLYIPMKSYTKIGYIGHTAVIPCQPTSPTYYVFLYAQNNRFLFEKVALNSRISFDPYVGFKIMEIGYHDRRHYKCEFRSVINGEPEFFIYDLNVISPPTIEIVNASKTAIMGEDFILKCRIDGLDKIITEFAVEWQAPDGNLYPPNFVSYGERITTAIDILDEKKGISSLKIENVTFKDSGMYECRFKSWDLMLVTQTTIHVYEPQLINVIMNLPSKSKFILDRYFDHDVELSATILTKSNDLNGIDVEWIFSYHQLIVSNDKYNVTTTSNYTQLIIKNVNVGDMGIYFVRVTHGHNVKTCNTTLRLWDGAMEFTTTFQSSYKPLTDIQIQSYVSRPPKKNITWYFQKYLDNHDEYEQAVLQKNTSLKHLETVVTSTLFLKVVTTGKIICRACFQDICDWREQIIVVADDNLEIEKSGDIFLEGSDFNTTCSASSYYYYSNITWQKKNGQMINKTDRIKISSQQNLYAYKSVMKIEFIKESDETAYKCVAVAKNGTTISKDEQLFIKVRDAPVTVTSNMNGTESVFDEETARKLIIVFTCYVKGSPKPKISWLKGDQPIVENSTVYKFSNGNQELRIVNPKKQHSGRYVCRATNNQNSKEVSQTVLIEKKHVIMGVILGTVILLITCIILAIYYITVRRSKMTKIHLTSADLTDFEEGDLNNLNSELTLGDQALRLPYNRKWEFPRENLKLQKRLGYGEFGVVMKAKAHDICENDAVTTVAVKMVKKSKYLKVLASELKILSHIGRHLNIVNLLGACTSDISKGELLVIVEYCQYGNLLSFLRKYRRNFINQIEPSTVERISPSLNCRTDDEITEHNNVNEQSFNAVLRKLRKDYPRIITTQDLLAWAFQVARGMEYLGQRRVFHGDLAARNVLLANNNVIKICDFGLSRNLYHYELYQKTSNSPMPLKWMAVESIRDRIFSTQSDVWSFGIFLWEIFTLASTPYPEFTSQEVYQKLTEGYRMGKSEYMTDEIYHVMLRCWNINPLMRPSFSDLAETIGTLLPKSVETHFINLNGPYVHLNATESDGARDYMSLMSPPDHEILMSRLNHVNRHLTLDPMDLERRASDVSSACSLNQVPNTSLSSDTTNAQSATSPNSSLQPVSVPSNSVTLLTSKLIGRIIGFKNPNYVSADSIVQS